MAYPDYMKELIKKVADTRNKRVEDSRQGISFPRLSLEAGEELLKKYHPDYRENAKRALAVGKNRGDRIPNELADILESYGHLDPVLFSPGEPDFSTDVLVIGGGGAGSTAALFAASEGARVLLVTKLRHGDANTMMAEGGIQAADKPADSPSAHFIDTMGGGHFTNSPGLVSALVADAPGIISWLEQLGVMFDKEEDGTMLTLHGGGTSKKRMHSAGDMTGAEIMRTLRDEIRNTKGIDVVEFSPAVELLLDEAGRCAGAVLKNLETGRILTVRSRTVIIATGGMGRLHLQGFPTTNHYGATADGIVLAYRAGAEFVFLDATQFHPTGVVYPEQNIGLLITEKVRGAGAQLLNIRGEQFVYPLEPRDIESSAIIRECSDHCSGIKTPTERYGVWLDSPMIEALKGKGFVEKNFPAKFRQFMRYGIDISKEPMLIYPTLHYQNGGMKITPDGETSVPNLFVAGEAAGGVHGRNRLMGNSLLDICVFGRRAGIAAAQMAGGSVAGSPGLHHLEKYYKELEERGILKGKGPVSPVLLPDYAGKIG